MIDRKKFFDGVRSGPFPGHLTQSQIDGMNIILGAWERSGYSDLRDLAYILATPIVETGWTMQPIKEGGGNAYYKRMYDIEGSRPNKARELGNVNPGDGARFPGMGFVQSTGRGNARKLTALVKEIFHEDVDFEKTPERLLEPKYAALALIVGLERGIFTGKKLADFLRSNPPNWREARRTVNALDRADEIAGYAKQFYADLMAAEIKSEAPPIAPAKSSLKEAAKDAGKVIVGGGGIGGAGGANAGWGWEEWLGFILIVLVLGGATFAVMYWWHRRKARDAVPVAIAPAELEAPHQTAAASVMAHAQGVAAVAEAERAVVQERAPRANVRRKKRPAAGAAKRAKPKPAKRRA